MQLTLQLDRVVGEVDGVHDGGRDAKITQIYEGANEVQRIVMARQLLNGVQVELQRTQAYSQETQNVRLGVVFFVFMSIVDACEVP